MTNETLITRAMLCTLSISAWSARKHDKQVTDETNKAHGADADAGRYNKMLLPGDAKSYQMLNSHIAATRVLHNEQTLPWNDKGQRLLPMANYQHYTDVMRAARHTYDTLLAEFLADYPALKDAAKLKLNGMFREDDYPSDLSRKYDFAVEYDPVPEGGDFRVELSQTEIDIIATKTNDRVKQRFEDAHKDAVKRLYECVARIHERLTTIGVCSACEGTGETIETRKRPNKGATVTCWICDGTGKKEASFKDTLVTNAQDVCDVLSRLNIAEDPNLETLRKKTAQLARVQPEILRTDPVERIQRANDAQSILDQMMNVYGKVGVPA